MERERLKTHAGKGLVLFYSWHVLFFFFLPSLIQVKCAARWCIYAAHWAAPAAQRYRFRKCVTCKSGERGQMDTQAVWMAPSLKRPLVVDPRAAKRTLFRRWQFMQRGRAAIHHPWQVKQCAQSVYVHNYKASFCPWAAAFQEHLLGGFQLGPKRRVGCVGGEINLRW